MDAELELTCGDNSCMFRVLRSGGGQATNGGCQCFEPLEAWIEHEKRWNTAEVLRIRRQVGALLERLRVAEGKTDGR